MQGTGIPRALQSWPDIELVDEVSGNQFRVVVRWPQVAGEATDRVTPEVTRLLGALDGERSRTELMETLALKDDEHFRKAYLLAALEAGLIERTIPDKPRSRLQKYRLTPAGRAWLQQQGGKVVK